MKKISHWLTVVYPIFRTCFGKKSITKSNVIDIIQLSTTEDVQQIKFKKNVMKIIEVSKTNM